ncbi:MAG TPA: carbohydrate kinase family protein [Terriglobales bacterium]|jgi:sugar/nucleoside kinase (ribokinase family)|nr:carbohydrate kinase family protein [Terriglobales bacterium]
MPRFDVTIAGELNLDLILYGLPRELPEERELLADGMNLTLGASSGIVAHNLACLGSKVGFISRIGDDPLGGIAVERLAESGVDISKVKRVSGSTKTGLTVILHHEGARNILTYPGTIFDLAFDDLDFEYLADSKHFHLSSFYLQRGLKGRITEIFRKLKDKGLTISLDTNDDPDDGWGGELPEALKLVDVFLPNEREIRKVAGTDDLEAAIARVAKIVPLLVVKIGPQGAIAQRGQERVVAPPVKVTPVDAVGAGDSFDAGFLSQYVRGADLKACLTAGNLGGALSTTRPGGTEAFRDREYRQQFLKSNR